MKQKDITASIVIPLYNEEQVFPILVDRLNKLLDSIPFKIEVVFISDGGTDSTADLMKKLALKNGNYQCVFLSRNYGHQIAISAGLMASRGKEAVMVMDGDLQDPPELFKTFFEKIKQGYDVVYGVRRKRKEGLIKRTCYFWFYRLLKKMVGIDIPLDSGDFGMMSKKVVNIINKMPENSRYLRGMRAWVGFQQIGIEYEREPRMAGTSKYDFSMLSKLAYNGIFNFSDTPIKLLTRLGLLAIFSSVSYLIYSIFVKLTTDTVPSGFTALLFVIVLFGGIQLISIGILGEYIIRMFIQVKNRPIFLINEQIVDKQMIEVDFVSTKN